MVIDIDSCRLDNVSIVDVNQFLRFFYVKKSRFCLLCSQTVVYLQRKNKTIGN